MDVVGRGIVFRRFVVFVVVKGSIEVLEIFCLEVGWERVV